MPPLPMNGLKNCGDSAKNMNEILTFACKWMELENFILSEVTQAQKQKSNVVPHMQINRPETNAIILLDMGHTLKGEHI
jgi:hypothetical protein